jgi:hypothetical protein
MKKAGFEAGIAKENDEISKSYRKYPVTEQFVFDG